MNSEKNKKIQGIRGIAALMVFFSHAFGMFSETHTGSIISVILGSPFSIFCSGTIGVGSFFVLSGYFADRKWENQFNVIKQYFLFVVNRFLRLWPAYFMSLITGFFIKCVDKTYNEEYIASFYLTYNSQVVSIKDVIKQSVLFGGG